MISKIKITKSLKDSMKFVAVLALMLAAVNFLGVHNMTFAATAGDVINPGDEIFDTSVDGSLRGFILQVINFFLGFLGLIAVGFLIYGGVLVVTSGAEEGIDKGKTVMKNAIIGIIIIVVSFALINTLIGGLASGTEV